MSLAFMMGKVYSQIAARFLNDAERLARVSPVSVQYFPGLWADLALERIEDSNDVRTEKESHLGAAAG